MLLPEVIHRFPNGPVRVLDALHWDVLRLYEDMLNGLRKAASQPGGIDCLGVDTWGVDFALLGARRDPFGKSSSLPGPDDGRRDGSELCPRVARGNLPTNRAPVPSLQYAFSGGAGDGLPLLDAAETLLFMPDLFHYFFTGVRVNEFTDASTSQMLDPYTKKWANELVEAMGLPTQILGSIAPPGTMLGPLRPSIASETGIIRAAVVLPASHDTASGRSRSVPASGTSWAYSSSGTWSLLGVEISRPVIDDRALRYNFTNEGGVGGTVRLLKNIMGLWLIQECRRAWQREGKDFSYEELARQGEASPPWSAVIDPDFARVPASRKHAGGHRRLCPAHCHTVPTEPGAVVRCGAGGAWPFGIDGSWSGSNSSPGSGSRRVHVVGGGSQNGLLCQFTADACNRPVLAGPVEATAIGNLLVQAIGRGLLGSLQDALEVVRRSFEVRTYLPQSPDCWEKPYERFLKYLEAEP